MKFELGLGDEDSGAYIKATPTELDGFPLVKTLALSRDIVNLSPDRCAVAAILTFAPYLSGQQVLPKPFSSLTAELMQRLMEPVWTHYSPLHPANVPIPRGRREIALSLAHEDHTQISELRLVSTRGDNGVTYEPDSMVVATNALDIDVMGRSSPLHPSRAALAAAVMLAEDLDIGTYVVSRQTAEMFNLESVVIELLNAVSIGVRVGDE